MGLKSQLIKPFAKYTSWSVDRWSKTAVNDQKKILNYLIQQGRRTRFGKDHGFEDIEGYKSFSKLVPVREYEGIKNYIESIIDGESNVLWPGIPKYFAKTSGTTSGVKYIPISKESMPNHINTARNALMNYIADSINNRIFDGKVIFLSGSPEMTVTGNIPTGRLSGIVNHEVPSWVRGNQLPSFNTNCVDDWEEKLEKIIDETLDQDMRLISGIPPWVQMYYDDGHDSAGENY